MARRRCAIYTRKSTDEGLEQSFNSLHAQREASEAYIVSQRHEGWDILTQAYDDGGYSGGNMERPALQRLLADIERGRIDVVVVYKVDRLTRSLTDFARIIEVFDRQTVSFVSVTQQFNTTTSMGRLTLNVLLSFAQFEREVTGERIRDKIAASKQKGLWMGGLPPLGYDIVDRQLVVNEPEANRVREMFTRYAHLRSLRRLKEELDREEITSKAYVSRSGRSWGGKPFSRNALATLLRNRLYIGEVGHKGKTYPGEHDAIVSRDLWDEVQTARCCPSIKHPRSRTRSLLAGLVRSEDGEPLTPTHAVKGGKRYRYYVSRSLVTGTARRGQAWRLPAAELEGLVLGAISDLLKDQHRLVETLRSAVPTLVPDRDLFARAGDLQEVLSDPAHAQLREVVQQVVTQVIVADGQIEILFQVSSASSPEAPEDDSPLCITVPARLRRCGQEMRLVLEAQAERAARPDPDLILAVAKARLWQDQLLSGKVPSVRAISDAEAVDERHVRRTLKLASLAPDIIEAILAGRQPPELTARRLRHMAIPLAWDDQRKALGMG